MTGRGGRRLGVAALAAALPVGFIVIFLAWPLVAVGQRAFRDAPSTGAGLSAADIVAAGGTTLGLALAGTALTLLVGLPAVWGLYRRSWRGADALAAALSAPFVLPTVVVALAFLALMRTAAPFLGAAKGLPAIVLALAFFNVAVVIRVVGPQFKGLDLAREAAAATLGATPSQVIRHVMWPSLRKAVLASAAVTFLFCAASFALVLVLSGARVRTLETAIYIEVTTFLNLRGAAVLGLVQASVIAAVALIVSRASRRPAPPHAARLPRSTARRRHAFTIALLVAPAATLVAVPLLALVASSLGGLSNASLAHYRALAAQDATGTSLLGPAGSSVQLGAATAIVTLVLACLTLAAAHLHPRLAWVTSLTAAPLAVSSVVVGLGLLVGLAGPLHAATGGGARWLLIAAQVLVALPLVTRVIAPAIESIDPRLLAAARTLGAPPTRVLTAVIVPIVRPVLAVGAGLAFAVAVGEFGASSFLARPGAPSLPTSIVALLARPGADNLALAAAGSVLLAAIAGGVMLAIEAATRRVKMP